MNEFMAEVQNYMHEHIPLTKAMDISVNELNSSSIHISAPLGPNINHRNSAFGGSISTLGITSGWTLLFSVLRKLDIPNRLVIKDSSTNFILPATHSFSAKCDELTVAKCAKFVSMLNRHGRARIKLTSKLYSNNILVATHCGTYVALKS